MKGKEETKWTQKELQQNPDKFINTPHLSKNSEEESEPENELRLTQSMFDCCNFDKIQELTISSLYMEDEEEGLLPHFTMIKIILK